jgi:3-oxoacyl-[acyl-carrier-protein] synthase-3
MRAHLDASAIGMVIAGGCSPQTTVPAEACRIAAALEIDAIAFDLNASCVSFLAQVHYLSMAQPEALPDFILVVNPENNTRAVDYNDRGTAVLWGDGTTAAVVSRRILSAIAIRDTVFGADPAGAELIRTPAGGHFRQDGRAVQTFAVRKTAELFQGSERTITDRPSPNYFVGHQANLRMLESACRRAGIAPESHLSNVASFGNCGAAGAPSLLSQHWGRLPGGAVRMAVVGAGLNWGSLDLDCETL